MRRLTATLLIALAGLLPAQAFETETQTALDRLKPGKSVPIDAVAVLMRTSERWCYFEAEGQCRWSDIYLDVGAEGARYEIGNAWNADYDIVFVDEGVFKEGRYICETGHDWVPSVRAISRHNGRLIGGRELDALKHEIADYVSEEDRDCFDYILQEIDAAALTVTLLQRQYIDGATDPGWDAPVTLHFDPKSAAALDWAY